MEIVQKKGRTKHIFTFKDDVFNFAYEDKTGSGDVDIQYATVPNKCHIRVEQNEWLRNVGYLWMLLGIFQLGSAIYANAPLAGKGFWLFIGLICIAISAFTKVKYSVFQSEQGNVFVMHGKSHDEIVNEVKTRKKAQLLKWYGEINPEGDVEKETAKFKWLHQEGALSKEEADVKIAQVESALRSKGLSHGKSLN